MNKMIAVLDTALVDRKDAVSRPGGLLRIKRTVVDDVRKGFAEIQFTDVTASAYRETLELERAIQERTGANRVTLGSSGVVKDTNQTLGGMELLKQMFNERVAAYGMVIETDFLIRAAEKMYALIYQELKPQDLEPILGRAPVQIAVNPRTGDPINIPRFMAFVFVSPEEINRSYTFKPMGIFSMENKVIKAAQIMDAMRIGAVDPRFDEMEALQYVLVNLQGIEEANKWFNPVPMIPITHIPPELHQYIGPPGEPGSDKGKPGLKGGKNGNQPSFLPDATRNPVRRSPKT